MLHHYSVYHPLFHFIHCRKIIAFVSSALQYALHTDVIQCSHQYIKITNYLNALTFSFFSITTGCFGCFSVLFHLPKVHLSRKLFVMSTQSQYMNLVCHFVCLSMCVPHCVSVYHATECCVRVYLVYFISSFETTSFLLSSALTPYNTRPIMTKKNIFPSKYSIFYAKYQELVHI